MYLNYGMSCDEFWNGDVNLAKVYRESFKLKQDLINEQAWLQGLYFHDALGSVLATMFGKKSVKYCDKPIELRQKEKTPQQIRDEMRASLNQIFNQLESINGRNCTQS